MRRFTSGIAAAAAAVAILATAGCKTDLNITNPNAPDAKRAVSNGADVQTLISGSYSKWFRTNQFYWPNQAFAVMADQLTSSFGNFGMRFNSQECPTGCRIAYANSSGVDDGNVALYPWNNNYSALGAASDGIRAINNGVIITDTATTAAYKSLGFMVQGLTLGNLGIIFDQAFIVDDKTDVTAAKPALQPYKAVAAAAVAKFDSAIATATGKKFTISTDVTTASLSLTAPKLVQMANTMAARVLAYTPRTAAENTAVDWARVLKYASAGISTGTGFDVVATGDGGTNWYDLFKAYGDRQSWMRVDYRVIHMMDPSQPVEYTTCTTLAPATSADSRLTTDFKYYSKIPFQSARGCYHFSNYAHERYQYTTYDASNPLTGLLPVVIQAENDLLIAEALIRTGGDKARAATLINKTRVTRGNLAPVSAANTDAQLLDALFYEREIELMNTGGGLALYDRRRLDGLQPGTPHHLPVPARELETLGLPIYTFGGLPPNPVFPVK